MRKALMIILIFSAVFFILGYIVIRSEGYKENPPENNMEFRYEKREF